MKIRLLIDDPHDGVTNMARDEALLEGVGQGDSPATLRFYQWEPPTISLGYFQKYEDYAKLAPPAGALAVVRRTTGGGAIMHDREWTYALTVPADHRLIVAHGPSVLYERMHEALIDALKLLNLDARMCGHSDDSSAHKGPFFCFERRHCYDVLLAGRKLCGSAQRRTRRALLQHGSVILANRFDQHQVAALQEHIFLEDAAILQPLVDALGRRLQAELVEGVWTPTEVARAETYRPKYADPGWTTKY